MTPEETTRLAALIREDPDGRGYGGVNMSDEDIAADLNERRHTMRRRVPVVTFTQYLWDQGMFLAIIGAAANGIQAAALAVAAFERVNAAGVPDFDLDSPATRGAIDAVVVAGVWTPEQRDGLMALADSPASLLEKNGLPPATHLDVARARRGE